MNARTDAERDDDAEGTQSGRWLISYADLITTLMVLFLALYVLQLAKVNALDARERTRARLDDAAARTAEPQAPARVPAWVAQLDALKAGGRISLVKAPHGIEIGIDAGILFHVGDAHLLPDALPVLERIAQALGPHATGDILVEGHSDSVPIANAKYESNWELSSARAGRSSAISPNAASRRIGSRPSAAPIRSRSSPATTRRRARAIAA